MNALNTWSPSTIKRQNGTEWLFSQALMLALIQLFHFEEQMQLDLQGDFHENRRDKWSGQMLALNQSSSLIIYTFVDMILNLTNRPREVVVIVRLGFTEIHLK